ncbi:response regulator [Oscillospiraceae bacterium PP1C4]
MLKVMIADDEVKVCQLIQGLVDWESFEMEIVAVAHNGIDALELIDIHNPDLVITDIRMPGYDGLEMIRRAKELNPEIEFMIISGYRHFDYAQSAIKYGVSDYLLKPIKKNELTNTLLKMTEKYKKKANRLSREENLKFRLKSDIDKLRGGFFAEVLSNRNLDASSLSLEKINQEYHFTFQKGSFQVVVIKMSTGYSEQNDSNIKPLEEKASQIACKILKPLCYDMEICFADSAAYCVLNYAPENKKMMRKQLKVTLDELLLQGAVFEHLEVALGLGTVVEQAMLLSSSLETAKAAVDQRLLLGTGKLLEEMVPPAQALSDIPLYRGTCRSLTGFLEILDKPAVLELCQQVKQEVKQLPNTSGQLALQFAKALCSVFAVTLRNKGFALANEESFIAEFAKRSERCSSVEGLFDYLSSIMETALDKIMEDKRLADTKPIRQAKQYIQKNYKNAISLEEVSSAVGFNTSYFSTLFKKESDQNFSEYLSEVRMEAAKTLLKETNSSIAAICEEVGYSDIKHFTKTFTKYAGLKPTEYRKLYA